MATRLLTQAARFVPLYGVEIQDATAEVRGRFSPEDKLGLEGPGGAFEEVSVVLEVRSLAPARRVRELVPTPSGAVIPRSRCGPRCRCACRFA